MLFLATRQIFALKSKALNINSFHIIARCSNNHLLDFPLVFITINMYYNCGILLSILVRNARLVFKLL